MKEILTSNLIVWLFIAGTLGITGYGVAVGMNKRIWLGVGVGAAILALALGCYCVYFVQTDQKRVQKAVMECAHALQQHDVEGALKHISVKAEYLRKLTEANVKSVKNFEKIRINSFRVDEINRTSSPPRARVSFRAVASGRSNEKYCDRFNVVVDFDVVELRLEQDGEWRINDNIEFHFPRI